MAASYGSIIAASKELGYVQDFLKAWMREFVSKSWDLLENGIAGGRDQHQSFLLALFKYMTSPEHSILPEEMVEALQPSVQIEPFIGPLVASVLDDASNPSKRQRTSWQR